MDALTARDVAPLFPGLLTELVGLLRTLDADAWQRRTIAGAWRVRDVAAHLLDGDLRKLSMHRDGHRLPMTAPIRDDRDLARFVNELNATGVAYGARLSTAVLVDLLAHVGSQVSALVASLPLHEPALFAVSWAGEMQSENWMDTGREYTERWHHQAQIRDAVGAPPLLQPHWFEPLLDFSVRALPVAYAATDAADGTLVELQVTGPTSAAYTLERSGGRWTIGRGAHGDAACSMTITADDAWRLLYNACDPEQASRAVQVHGDRALAAPLLCAR